MGRIITLYNSLLHGSKLRHDLFQTQIVNKLDDFLEATTAKNSLWSRLFKRKTAKKGVYLYGSVGSGKTMLMDLFHMAARPAIKCKRSHYNEFMLDVHSRAHELGHGKGDKEQQIAKQLASEFAMLCLDEFQVIDIADAMMLRKLMGELVLKQNIRMFLTSNRAPDSLYERGAQRESFLPCISIMKQHFLVLDLSSQDYRLNRIIVDKRIFTKKEEFDSAMTSFSTEWTKGSVEVYGRIFEISKQSGKVCWLNFVELCTKGASVADMISIARTYDVVGIEHVPQFTAHSLEQVRRFINIVDVLYERQTRLLLHLQVPLHELLMIDSVSDETFAIMRTLSRLEQMQSLEWWTTHHSQNE